MENKRLVIAVGGNAIENLPVDDKPNYEFKELIKQISILAKYNNEIIITHGNGPQVGYLLLQQEIAKEEVKGMPLYILIAMTQAQIGYILQKEISSFLMQKIPVFTILTQVEIDENDPNFKNPTKPIGPIYTKSEAIKLSKEKGYVIKKVPYKNGFAYRRVVASPEPKRIVELEIIKEMINKGIVISCGGGGIPVIIKDRMIKGVDAVIDKDLTSSKLAIEVEADMLIILTNVEKVKLNFGKPDEKEVSKMSLEEAKKYFEEGHFLEGSMKPKMQACINFVEATKRPALIASTKHLLDSINGYNGTLIFI